MIRPVLGILLIVIGTSTQDTPRGKFSCENRPSGYYADLDTGCQIYHMCDGLGRQFSYSCPNATLFQQRMLICDHWYMVNCSKSEGDYRANLLIGQQDKPFVEDSEKHPYQRTPRPDLLSNPDVQEYNVIYRNGRSQYVSDLNLVGIETDHEESDPSVTTDRPTYSLPSHWFTEFSKGATTQRTQEKRFDIKQYKISKNNQEYNEINSKKVVTENNKTKVKVVVNQNDKFALHKKHEVNVQSDDVKINFKNTSQFSVERRNQAVSTKEISNSNNNAKTYTNNNYQQNKYMTPPSIFYEPPNFEFYDSSTESAVTNSNAEFNKNEKTIKTEADSTEKRWKDLRLLFLIPDYEFPLDPVSRPSYENGHSSFEVNPIPSDSQQK